MIFGALEAIAAFGMIEQGRRLAHGVMADECEICRIDNRSYDIILPDIMTNFEQHESLVERHYTRIQAEKSDKSVKEMIEKEGFSTLVESLLENNVYVFREHFIGYDAHPDLDDFFFGKAALALQAQSGYDTFSYRLEFGGILLC